jgi:hypothetical protein
VLRPSPTLIQRSTWNKDSANFAYIEFSETELPTIRSSRKPSFRYDLYPLRNSPLNIVGVADSVFPE